MRVFVVALLVLLAHTWAPMHAAAGAEVAAARARALDDAYEVPLARVQDDAYVLLQDAETGDGADAPGAEEASIYDEIKNGGTGMIKLTEVLEKIAGKAPDNVSAAIKVLLGNQGMMKSLTPLAKFLSRSRLLTRYVKYVESDGVDMSSTAKGEKLERALALMEFFVAAVSVAGELDKTWAEMNMQGLIKDTVGASYHLVRAIGVEATVEVVGGFVRSTKLGKSAMAVASAVPSKGTTGKMLRVGGKVVARLGGVLLIDGINGIVTASRALYQVFVEKKPLTAKQVWELIKDVGAPLLEIVALVFSAKLAAIVGLVVGVIGLAGDMLGAEKWIERLFAEKNLNGKTWEEMEDGLQDSLSRKRAQLSLLTVRFADMVGLSGDEYLALKWVAAMPAQMTHSLQLEVAGDGGLVQGTSVSQEEMLSRPTRVTWGTCKTVEFVFAPLVPHLTAAEWRENVWGAPVPESAFGVHMTGALEMATPERRAEMMQRVRFLTHFLKESYAVGATYSPGMAINVRNQPNARTVGSYARLAGFGDSPRPTLDGKDIVVKHRYTRDDVYAGMMVGRRVVFPSNEAYRVYRNAPYEECHAHHMTAEERALPLPEMELIVRQCVGALRVLYCNAAALFRYESNDGITYPISLNIQRGTWDAAALKFDWEVRKPVRQENVMLNLPPWLGGAQ